MDSGHSRGDRRLDGEHPGGRWGSQSDYDAVYGRDADRDWHAGYTGGYEAPMEPVDAVPDPEWLNPPADDAAGPAEFDVNGYRRQLLSGPGAELYGMGGGGFAAADESAAYAAFDERSLDAGPVSRPSRPSRPSYDSGSLSGPSLHAPFRDDPRDTGSYGAYGHHRSYGSHGAYDSYGPPSDPHGGRFDPGPFSGADLRYGGYGEPSQEGPPRRPPSPWPRNPEPESPVETSGLVRPYFRTKGRTRPTYDLALEALISTSEEGRRLDRVRVPEHRSICGLCLDTRSVAEVAALLKLPLGVARILVGDVAGLGLVFVHSTTTMVGDRPSIEFMERVLSGLRRI